VKRNVYGYVATKGYLKGNDMHIKTGTWKDALLSEGYNALMFITTWSK
jgi:hypothetical protein